MQNHETAILKNAEAGKNRVVLQLNQEEIPSS